MTFSDKLAARLRSIDEAALPGAGETPAPRLYFLGLAAVILSAVIYGFMPFAARLFRAEGGDPILLALLRFFFSSFFLAPLVRLSGHKFHLSKYEAGRVLAVGLGYAVTPPLLYMSYEYLDTGVATVLHFSYPAFVILLCAFLWKEKPGLTAILCLGLCFLGVLLIQSGDNSSGAELAKGDRLRHFGFFLAVFSGLTYALYIIFYAKSRLIAFSLFKLAFYLNFTSFLFLLPFRCLSGPFPRLSFRAFLIAALLGFSCSLLATLLFQFGTSCIGAQKAALLSTFEPVVSLSAAALILEESISFLSFLGMILILTASLLVAFEKKKKKKVSEESAPPLLRENAEE